MSRVINAAEVQLQKKVNLQKRHLRSSVLLISQCGVLSPEIGIVPRRWVPQIKDGSEVVIITVWGTIFNPGKKPKKPKKKQKSQAIKIILQLFSPTKFYSN